MQTRDEESRVCVLYVRSALLRASLRRKERSSFLRLCGTAKAVP